MSPRNLINEDGEPFDSAEIRCLRSALDALSNLERTQFRNDNAQAIALHGANKILIISGPGTGKSTIFKQRIKYWLQDHPEANVLAVSFVRKLVNDLQKDISSDSGLTKKQKKKIDVSTLHKYARSIVEKNNGCAQINFRAHFKIIGESWKYIIWNDTLLYTGQTDSDGYSFDKYEKQSYNANFDNSDEWQTVRRSYLSLCKFYNAAGFADLIIYARNAIAENVALNDRDFIIIDEYQDFNIAEKELIDQLSQQVQGILIVGDDDQVLYEKLKLGKAQLIRDLYNDTDLINAMLPFCSRSSMHIAKTAGYFISQNQESECIDKIYLPLSVNTDCPKVQVIACAKPITAVDYIENFINNNRLEIETRKNDLNSGTAKDPFLLILTPAKEIKFYANKGANKKLFDLVKEFHPEEKKLSDDYYKLLDYYSLANHPNDNYIFRKVLAHEQVIDEDVIIFIKKCLFSNKNICDINERIIVSILERCQRIKHFIESSDDIATKISNIENEISLSDKNTLKENLESHSVSESLIQDINRDIEDAEMDKFNAVSLSAVEIMTIVGAKGLSADHVIIIGFDNVNMSWITKNAFYVAMTRARKSLHIITAFASGGSQGPNDFINQLPNQHIEFYKYTKSNKQKTLFNNIRDFRQYFVALNYMRQRGKE